jgi:uncharacterized protein DUF6966
LTYAKVKLKIALSREVINSYAAGRCMCHYEHCLHAMLRLLEAVGENHWSAWIREDIRLWQTASDTSHHLSAYGGMGSFNDVWICGANQKRVTAAQEPWAHVLFEWLKTLCYYMAQHPKERITADNLRKTVGRRDATLAAFVGGDKAPVSMRGLVIAGRKLQGWCCFDCSYAEVSTRDIEYAIAQDLIPLAAFQACEAQTLDTLVDTVLRLNVPGMEDARHEIAAITKRSGIIVNDKEGWMRPCPNCGKENTAIYRWRSASGPPVRFVPADDNLPTRK